MKWSNKSVLVTGGAGFIGSHLTRKLLKESANVAILDNFSAGNTDNVPHGCRVINGDVRDGRVLDKIGYADYVFHLGSPSSVILFNKKPSVCVETTVCGFLNILEWSKDRRVKKVVYPSSGSVYGSAPLPNSEDSSVVPMNLYGISKLTCEHIARVYSKEVPTVGIRIFAGYGPGEEHKTSFASPVTLFLNSIIKDEKPVVYGDGTQSRDFVYIDDIIEAIIRAAERNVVGIINVGSGRSYSFNEVIECINHSLNKDIAPLYVPKPVNYLEKTLADTEKMKKLLDIDPLNLEEGLERYLGQILYMR